MCARQPDKNARLDQFLDMLFMSCKQYSRDGGSPGALRRIPGVFSASSCAGNYLLWDMNKFPKLLFLQRGGAFSLLADMCTRFAWAHMGGNAHRGNTYRYVLMKRLWTVDRCKVDFFFFFFMYVRWWFITDKYIWHILAVSNRYQKPITNRYADR